MNAGKAIRWKHIFRDDGKAVIVARAGRNMFRYEDPTAVVAALVKIVHEGASVDEAYKLIS